MGRGRGLESGTGCGLPALSPGPRGALAVALPGHSIVARCGFRSGLFLSLQAGQAFRKFLPLFDRVLVERSAAETVTKGGIMLPEKAQGKVLQATVVAVGSGAKGKVSGSHVGTIFFFM